jgi:hypothetical protein
MYWYSIRALVCNTKSARFARSGHKYKRRQHIGQNESAQMLRATARLLRFLEHLYR